MIGDARANTRGPFLREREFRQLAEASKSATPLVKTPGVNTIRTPFGTVLDFRGTGTLWVYAFATTSTHVVCKLAVDTGTRFAVVQSPSAFMRIRMAPGYKPEHYLKHLVTTPQPTLIDQVCRIDGGLCYPHYRFGQIVDAAPVSALLPSCFPAAEAPGGESCCDDCAQASMMAEAMGLPAPEGCACGG